MTWCVPARCSNNTFFKKREKGASFYSFLKVENLKKTEATVQRCA